MTITIAGHRTFEIPNDKVQELLAWLVRNSIKLEQNNVQFGGDILING